MIGFSRDDLTLKDESDQTASEFQHHSVPIVPPSKFKRVRTKVVPSELFGGLFGLVACKKV
jgi:hypothetical protein